MLAVHIKFHTLKHSNKVLGNKVYFDEYVGKKRLKFKAIISDYQPNYCIEYQMIKGVKLPIWLRMEFTQQGSEIEVMHAIKVGFSGWFKSVNYLISPFITKKFVMDLENHAEEEFNRLSKMDLLELRQ